MRIYFDNVNLSSRSGPNTFAARLATALYGRGHELVAATDSYDIMLAFIEPTHECRKGARLVQRLDGIWFKPEQFHMFNRGIKSCYTRADLVIWQSDFDRGMTKFHWGDPKKGKVIHNGIDMTPVPAITIPSLQSLRNDHEMLFVCSSNWHPQKRLQDNIALFEHLKENFYPNSTLIVMGSNPDALGGHSIHYTGNVDQQTYLQVMSAANWMFHLAWLDHCPNVVIEALSQGTPVICSSEGGTKELVNGYGLVLDEKPYGFELLNYDDPPRVDVTQVDAPLPVRETLGEHANIDIERAARAYERALEGVL